MALGETAGKRSAAVNSKRCQNGLKLGQRMGYGIGVGRVRYQRNRDAGAQWRFQKVVAWLTSYRTVGCHCHLSPVL
jgi:hypothetical protein